MLVETIVGGVNDGARTRDNRNHNPGLYQLSYAHHNIDTVFSKIDTCKYQPKQPLIIECSINMSIKILAHAC